VGKSGFRWDPLHSILEKTSDCANISAMVRSVFAAR